MIEHVYRRLKDGRLLAYYWFPAMHSRMDILVCWDGKEQDLDEIVNQAGTIVYELERKFNKFDIESELSRLNAGGRGKCSRDLYDIIRQSIAWNRKTLGYFDISLGKGIGDVKLDGRTRIVELGNDQIKLDLSGCAKGYALDCIKEQLINQGIKDALINFGNSSVAAIGHTPLGKQWSVKINDEESGSDFGGEIHLKSGMCLSVSGNNSDDRQHIVNPLTGEFKKGRGLMYVVTGNAFVGEVLSTALYAAPVVKRDEIALVSECYQYSAKQENF